MFGSAEFGGGEGVGFFLFVCLGVCWGFFKIEVLQYIVSQII